MTRFLPLLLAWLLLAPLAGARAHGGVYRGPGSGVPPGGGPSGGGPSTPGPGGAAGLADWSTWWAFHRDSYLALKDALRAGRVASGSSEFYQGRGGAAGADPGAPAAGLLAERVVPALLEALEGARTPDLTTGCLMALAKIGVEPSPDEPVLRARIASFLTDDVQEVAETAAIALGVLGDEAAAPVLAGLLGDTEAGRARIGEGEVPLRTRALAAYALGLLAANSARAEVRAFCVHHLAHALESDATATRDLATACVISLGLVELESEGVFPPARGEAAAPGTSREALLAWLLRWTATSDAQQLVRAHAPVALARLAGGCPPAARAAVVERLLVTLAPRKDERQDLRRPATTALGLLGDEDADPLDVRIRDELGRLLGDRDGQVRGLAAVALARVVTRPGSGPDAGAALEPARRRFVKLLAGQRSTMRSWAGLALGLTERRRMALGGAPSGDARAALRAALEEAKGPRDAGAFCIALGLASDPASERLLLERLGGSLDDGLRAHAAVGLGLGRMEGAREPLRAVVSASLARPGLLREAAIGLGLLGDRQLAPDLVRELGRAKTLSARSALAAALGQVGDGASVPPLLELLAQEELGESTRAFAAVALGILCDDDPLPWNSRLAVDVYYGQPPSTLIDPAGGRGILDLL